MVSVCKLYPAGSRVYSCCRLHRHTPYGNRGPSQSPRRVRLLRGTSLTPNASRNLRVFFTSNFRFSISAVETISRDLRTMVLFKSSTPLFRVRILGRDHRRIRLYRSTFEQALALFNVSTRAVSHVSTSIAGFPSRLSCLPF